LRSRSYLLALAFFVLALLSKPMAVSFPFILLVLDWFPFGRIKTTADLRSSLIEKIPLLLIGASAAFITVLAKQSANAVVSLEQLSLVRRLFVSLQVPVLYLGKMVLPIHLIPFYPYPKTLSPADLFPVLLVTGITVAAIWYARYNRLWLAVWSTYIVMLLPVLGIVQVSSQLMADRYIYLSSIGPFFLAGLGAAMVYSRCRETRHQLRFPKAALCAGTGVVLLIALSNRTNDQIGIWKDSVTLWNYTIEQTPDNAEAYNSRGLYYGKAGEIEKALDDFRSAVQYAPQDYRYHNNLGVTYDRLGMYDDAVQEYSAAIDINQSYAEAIGNRAALFLRAGDIRSALRDIERSCDLGYAMSCATLQMLQTPADTEHR
jgi:hypothetical protein